MKNSYNKPLNVSESNGKRIIAHISQLGNGETLIQLPFIKEVKLDGSFETGVIKAVARNRAGYLNAIEKIENYLESLFLKELNNDNLHSGDIPENKSGRNTGAIVGVDKGKSGGDRSVESVYSGTRRSDPSKSNRGRRSGNKVVKEDSTEGEGSSKERN